MAQTGETASSGQRPNPFQPAVARDMRESKQIRDMLKPEAFSGKPEDFPEFEESLVSFMATWGMETLLEHAAHALPWRNSAPQCGRSASFFINF